MAPSPGSYRHTSLRAANQIDTAFPNNHQSSPSTLSSTSVTKTRTSHACDRCRTMRTKCSGGNRCAKCVKDNEICVYGDRKRERNKKDLVESLDRVQVLEDENRILVTALQQIVPNIEDLTDGYSDVWKILDRYQRAKDLKDTDPQDSQDQDQSQQSPTDTFDSLETSVEHKRQPQIGERYASSSVGSPGNMGELSRVVNLDHGGGAAGFIGKLSEMSWMQRAREYLLNASEQQVFAASAEYDSHSSAAQDLAYFMDDWDLLAVDEDHVDPLWRPSDQVALLLVEAYLHSADSAFLFITRNQIFDLLSQLTHHDHSSTWLERRFLAIANMVWAIGSKWLHLMHVDQTLLDNHLVYYARARALGIDHRVFLDHPDVDMVQGIGLLAFYLFTNGSITRARNVLGHAIQHATALGLHLKTTDANISQTEQERRAKIWYSLYSLDIMIAEVTGRPLSVQLVQISTPLEMLERRSEDLAFPNSAELQQQSRQLWDQFLQTCQLNVVDEALASRHTGASAETLESAQTQVLIWHIKLCQLSDEIARQIYCGGGHQKTWADMQDAIEHFQADMQRWDKGVRAALHAPGSMHAPQDQPIPLSLVMYQQSVLMILHRACLCEISIVDESQRSRDFNVASARACVNAALAMLQSIPDDPFSVQIWYVLPWWTLLHYICQALAVILIQLCLDCQHCPAEKPQLVGAAGKAMSYLRCMADTSLSAYRAYRILRQLLTKVSTRYGGPTVFGLSEPIEHPPHWTELHELSLPPA